MALSPWTAIAQGVGHGEKEVRERRREDEKRADEQAMEMWKTLLAQGFTVGDPEKGSPDGTMVRVGRIGHLIPPAISKNELEQKKMEFDRQMMDAKMRVAEMQEGTAKAQAAAKLAEIEANGARYIHDENMRGLENEIKRTQLESQKITGASQQAIAEANRRAAEARAAQAQYALEQKQLEAGEIDAPKPLTENQRILALDKMRELKLGFLNPTNAEAAHASAGEYNELLGKVDPTARYVMRPVIDKGWVRDKLKVEPYKLPVKRTKDGLAAVTVGEVIANVGSSITWNNKRIRFDNVPGIIEFFEDIRKQHGDMGGPFIWPPDLYKEERSSTAPGSSFTPETKNPTSSTAPPLGRTGPPVQPGQQLNVTPGLLKRVPPPQL